VKFFGAPLITAGGFTFDFTEKKVECKDEYFMTTRIGNLAFRDIANFFVTIMDRYVYFAHCFTREISSITSLALAVLHLFLSKFPLFFSERDKINDRSSSIHEDNIKERITIFFAFLFPRIRYKWRKVDLVYATNGQSQVAGRHTCQLMMKSMVEFIKKEQNITYGTFDVEATTPSEYPEALRDHIGSSYGGE